MVKGWQSVARRKIRDLNGVGSDCSRWSLLCGFRVKVCVAIVVFEQQALGRNACDALREQGDFSAAAGRVYDVGRHGVSRGVPAQSGNTLQSALHACPEMGGALDGVALVQIIGSDPRTQ